MTKRKSPTDAPGLPLRRSRRAGTDYGPVASPSLRPRNRAVAYEDHQAGPDTGKEIEQLVPFEVLEAEKQVGTLPVQSAPNECPPLAATDASSAANPVVPRSFFQRPAEAVARDLLGKRLVRLLPSSNETMRLTGIIVETEAYCGEDDKACHIYAGRRTKRTEIIYGPKGHAYVYFTYGMHHMLNVVCGSESYPEAVLIRALQPEVESVATMRTLRSTRKRKAEAVGGETAAVKHVKEMREADLCSGPAKLCQAMGIDLAQNGVDMTCTDAGLYFEDVGVVDEASEETAIAIQAGPRIGIDYAAEWKDKPLRFFYDQNPHVSLFKANCKGKRKVEQIQVAP